MGGKFSKRHSANSATNKIVVHPGYEDTCSLDQVKINVRSPPVKPPPEVPQKSEPLYRALYDYKAINTDDLSFTKGDLLKVETSSQNNDWWIATNQRTKKNGYIPSNFVCIDDDSPKNQEWWFDVDHKGADRTLLAIGLKPGTFLIREASDKASFVLSVRSVDSIKHYRIKFLDNGGVFIHTKRQFSTVAELIAFYKKQTDGLCTLLTKACPKDRPMPSFSDLEENRCAVKTTKLLGKGHFGEVWKGKLNGVFDVAVKKLKPGTMSSSAFLDEAKSLHALRHRNLVELVAVCSKEEPILIVTELMENGSLLDYLRKDEGKTITFETIVDMASQIACGMSFLETKNYVHRDLRAANVLVGKSLNVKIADLGLARLCDEDDQIYKADQSSQFPIKWTSPEALNKRQFSTKSDVWSFGILLYELITFGRMPYPGMTGKEAMDETEKGYRMPEPSSPIEYPPAYYDAMLSCWHKDPKCRPTFEYLYELFDSFTVSAENKYREV